MREPTRGRWWFVSMLSLPALFISLSGVFGESARSEAEVALGDWTRYGTMVLAVGGIVVLGLAIGAAIILLGM